MSIETYDGKCCRVWPLAAGYPVGKCGLCGEVPVPVSDLKTPTEWAEYEGIEILDADGWRTLGSPPFDQPITHAEFEHRVLGCTIRLTPMSQGRFWK